MKKTAVFALAGLMMTSFTAYAQHTQYDIQETINSAFSWLETNSPPQSAPGSAASDFYVMALSRMNKDYNYMSYVDAANAVNPSTTADAQRHIMAVSACGAMLLDQDVAMYTYNAQQNSASDIAGAIITLRSGGYEIPESSGTNLTNMTGKLLTMQQSDGSFDNDILATAKTVIALSEYQGTEFQLQGSANNEVYTYNTDSAITAALDYLGNSQQADGGYSTVYNTSFVIMALDSVGIDCESDSRFVKSGSSPIDYIYAHSSGDGSINSSRDDTAIASCALTSHLRGMQGKSSFFDFISDDTVNNIISGDSGSTNNLTAGSTGTQNSSGSSSHTSSTAAPQSTPKTITVTQPPTREPEHSSLDAEDYGPQQFVGPVEENVPDNDSKNSNTDDTTEKTPVAAIVVIIIVCVIAAAVLVFIKLYPDKAKEISERIRSIIDKKKDNNTTSQEKKENETPDLLSEIDASHEAVPTEELYDPDFIKKLIPVDEIDTSIDGLIPDDNNDVSDNENTDNSDNTDQDNKN